MDDFNSGHVDEVYMVYTNFINTMKQEPVFRSSCLSRRPSRSGLAWRPSTSSSRHPKPC